ncbi:related to O-methyltransferase [Ramularia collo-cygni]|uniref:Related to O-methyltransferase n=1 Tax=Ramularia collo-cygni TaxID=112498 RepID=A0A2D3V9P0_9PEZI|nr:related to O-methyltransferase [Ramularia collo-cygni]CZT18239.1 related to O-methyltransferase [Ramularia collo-cygni]
MSNFGSNIDMKKALDAQKSLSKNTPQLEHALSNSKANGLPEISINASQGTFLSILCKMTNAKNILEIGTLGGYSTLWFAESVPGVQVTSIEIDPHHRDVAVENTKGCDNVEILLGAALDILPKLAQQGKVFDFIFIDANWEEQAEYFDWAVKLTRKGGCIYVDNVVRQIMQDGEKDMALVEFVKDDERVEASLVPIFQSYERDGQTKDFLDGFMIAAVK